MLEGIRWWVVCTVKAPDKIGKPKLYAGEMIKQKGIGIASLSGARLSSIGLPQKQTNKYLIEIQILNGL